MSQISWSLLVLGSPGGIVPGFEFSKTAVHCCTIYDKTREVKTHNKKWFYEVWKAHGWDEVSPVIRVEFRYDRTCLREMGIEEPFDMLDKLSRMWGYSTQLWLRHTEPSIDETQSRWPLSDVWQVVQESAVYGNPTPLLRDKKIELDADRAMAGFVGYATSWAVRSGLPLSVVQEDGGGFMEWSFEPMQGYLDKRKDATFVDVMREKAFRIRFETQRGGKHGCSRGVKTKSTLLLTSVEQTTASNRIQCNSPRGPADWLPRWRPAPRGCSLTPAQWQSTDF